MLLLNISDIHFRHPICSGAMDPDRPFRTRLVQDVRDRIATWGSVGAILVGGDIAFAGAVEEYEAAYQWLQELASACGCPLERIFVIPGNHDVDRRVIQHNLSCRNALRAVATANPADRERELFLQFQNADTGRDLLASIETYNAFAARFNCQVYTPERLFWQQDLPLDEKTVLRIYGLTSTLLSWSACRDDRQHELYLSPLQTVLDPLDGYVNMVMCHHPPDWCMDNDEIEDAIRGRAAIQFFGHKHRQRITRDPYFIRFSSGAVNPDHREVSWEPGYNLVQLSTLEDGTERFLDVEAQLLVWQTNPDTFRPKQSETGDVFRHRLRIRGSVPYGQIVMSAAAISSTSESPSVLEVVTVVEQEIVEPTMSDDKTRNLVLRFWNLASSERREIALQLGLIEPEDIRLPEAERYGRAFQRAGELGLLERVAEEIQMRERT